MRRDSGSSSFTPVLPMCGAVMHDDLAVVRRVGQGLLVAGHAGGEHRLAEGLPHGPVGTAAEGPAVLQDEYGGSSWRLPWWRSSSCCLPSCC